MSYSIQIRPPHDTPVFGYMFQEHGMRYADTFDGAIKPCIMSEMRWDMDEIVAAEGLQVVATVDLGIHMRYQEGSQVS